MSKEKISTRIIAPGPFQKYLFSSSCYVQIGECYKILQKLRANSEDINNPDFISELESTWEAYIIQLLFGSISEHSTDAEEKADNEWVDMDSLVVEVTAISKIWIHEFLVTLNFSENHNISLNRFFSLWVFSCETTYQELINSDAFTAAIAKLISTISNMSDPAGHN